MTCTLRREWAVGFLHSERALPVLWCRDVLASKATGVLFETHSVRASAVSMFVMLYVCSTSKLATSWLTSCLPLDGFVLNVFNHRTSSMMSALWSMKMTFPGSATPFVLSMESLVQSTKRIMDTPVSLGWRSWSGSSTCS